MGSSIKDVRPKTDFLDPPLQLAQKLRRIIGLQHVHICDFSGYPSYPGCDPTIRVANNESSEVIDILLPVTFYVNPSTRLDNVKNLTIRF